MIKRIKENLKSKKGFTLVELIVVIVIILVLSAVMVPSVLKYIERANQANTKSDAATILTQVQADIAEMATQATDVPTVGQTVTTVNGLAVKRVTALPTGADLKKDNADKVQVVIDVDNDVTNLFYADGKYYITWSNSGGWVGPNK